MKGLLWLLLAFGSGWMIGRPSRPAPQNCIVEEKAEPSPAQIALRPTSSGTATPKTLLEILQEGGYKGTPKASPSPTPTEEVKDDKDAKDEKSEKTPEAAVETDSDGDPVKLSDEDVKKWIKAVVNSATRWIGNYEMEGMKVTLTADKYSHLPKLRAALTAANLRVTEEGALNVGDLVYFIVVKGQ